MSRYTELKTPKSVKLLTSTMVGEMETSNCFASRYPHLERRTRQHKARIVVVVQAKVGEEENIVVVEAVGVVVVSNGE